MYITIVDTGKKSVELSPFMKEHELSTPLVRYILKEMLKTSREQQAEEEKCQASELEVDP